MDNLDFNYFCTDCKQSKEYREANCFTNYKIRNYNRGEYIVFKGDIVKELTIVVEGSVNVSFVLDSGLIMRSVNHKAPTPIGGVAIFSKENRYRADIKALEPCTTISVSREDVLSQMRRCEDFILNLIDFPASRVDELTKHLAIVTQRSIKSKLAYYILTCSDGSHFRFDKSIKELSEYICVERPSLSRTISQLVDEGIISHYRGVGEIIDSKALQNLVL